jgi:hypothetical protein
MGNFFDFNDAESQRERGELIPNGALCKVLMKIRPGGEESSQGWLTESKISDAVYLDCEFTVLGGEFTKRRLWQNLTVAGGNSDGKGGSSDANISRSTIRAMLESAKNISPADRSGAAAAKRQIAGFVELDNLVFAIKVGVESGKDGYADRNFIALVITPDREEYPAIMNVHHAGTASPGAAFAVVAARAWVTGASPQTTAAHPQAARVKGSRVTAPGHRATPANDSTGTFATPAWAQ